MSLSINNCWIVLTDEHRHRLALVGLPNIKIIINFYNIPTIPFRFWYGFIFFYIKSKWKFLCPTNINTLPKTYINKYSFFRDFIYFI